MGVWWTTSARPWGRQSPCTGPECGWWAVPSVQDFILQQFLPFTPVRRTSFLLPATSLYNIHNSATLGWSLRWLLGVSHASCSWGAGQGRWRQEWKPHKVEMKSITKAGFRAQVVLVRSAHPLPTNNNRQGNLHHASGHSSH